MKSECLKTNRNVLYADKETKLARGVVKRIRGVETVRTTNAWEYGRLLYAVRYTPFVMRFNAIGVQPPDRDVRRHGNATSIATSARPSPADGVAVIVLTFGTVAARFTDFARGVVSSAAADRPSVFPFRFLDRISTNHRRPVSLSTR